MKELRYRILFLSGSYPNRTDNKMGSFVRHNAETLAKHCEISLLFVTPDQSLVNEKYEINAGYENSIYAVRVYFNPASSGLMKVAINYFRFVKAHYLGLQSLKTSWGNYDFVHLHEIDKIGFIALLLNKMRGIKYVITLSSNPSSKSLKFINRIILHNSEFINISPPISTDHWKQAGVKGNYVAIPYFEELNSDKGPDDITRQMYINYKKYFTKWKAGNTATYINISPEWNVLDVGSGHQPNNRANIILDKYISETIHRTTQKIVIPIDKYLIVADALFIPFKDKSFQFVIASHIAEHIDDPVKFCSELKRVAERGYIETPGPLTEFMMPDKSHKWVVNKIGNKLQFRSNHYNKPFSRTFSRLFYLYNEENIRTLNRDNKLIILLNFLITKIWKYIPRTYTTIVWDKELTAEVIK